MIKWCYLDNTKVCLEKDSNDNPDCENCEIYLKDMRIPEDGRRLGDIDES